MATRKVPKQSQIPETYAILPLRNSIFFPGQTMPLSVARKSSLLVLQEAQRGNIPLLILGQRDASVEHPGAADLHPVGTIAKILKVFNLPDGSRSILAQGVGRAQILSFTQEEPFLKAIARQVVEEEEQDDMENRALVDAIRTTFRRIAELSPDLTEEHLSLVLNTEGAGAVADCATALINAPVAEKQEILETVKIKDRLKKVSTLLGKSVNTLEMGNKIRTDVQQGISKAQREFYLREQLKAISKELGEDSENIEAKELRKRLTDAKLPDEVRKAAEKELERLARMHPSSAEYTVARTYLEWLLELPWLEATQDNLDIGIARTVLEQDHYGLDKVKKRILEYLAIRKLKNDMRGPILCFVGPPGVGKTSLGRSIANALGRKFVRISLGGVHDEAEIRGHRRTYIGALPGRIIQGIKKAGSSNPVFMMDEIDKIGMDFRGDPSSALLEVLDPEQNGTFSDHYIELPFDLSKVLFVATANILDPIPAALRDRMEIVEIPSYVEDEKVHIARDFLVPKQRAAHGVGENQVQFTEDALRQIISGYTREAGVRNLERRIADTYRGIATQIVEGTADPIVITPDTVNKYLGTQKFYSDVAERINKPGIATGLAWTPVGGDILFIEVAKMKGDGKLILTGQLGDVMKESARAALTYVASQAGRLGIDESFKDNYDIHVHVPAGATPKDGPSAGVTILAALASVMTGRLVRNDLAMTGEITLRGAVLPVGGIREKVLAAHRAGIKVVIMPERNKHDVADLPKRIVDSLEFHFVKEMDELLSLALRQEEGVATVNDSGQLTHVPVYS